MLAPCIYITVIYASFLAYLPKFYFFQLFSLKFWFVDKNERRIQKNTENRYGRKQQEEHGIHKEKYPSAWKINKRKKQAKLQFQRNNGKIDHSNCVIVAGWLEKEK